MRSTDDPATDTTADAMRAASDRRLASRADFIIPRPARRDLPIKNRRHSVRHRAIR